jgi:DNA-binding SARP family transcriptional activator
MMLRPRLRPRESIAADLWPDGDGTSTTSLRQALWLARSSLSEAGADPDAIFETDDDAIGLRAASSVDLDVVQFEALIQANPAQPLAAIALYGGELAEGLNQECFVRERERLADLHEDALAKVAAAFVAMNQPDEARTTALRLIGLDPLREEAHAALIEVYGRTGTRSQVVRQYRRLRTLLHDELDVEPLPETEATYRAALKQSWVMSARRQAMKTLLPSPSPGEPHTLRPDGLID